jgi:phage gp45-like
MENQDATLGGLRRATILKVDDSGPQQLVDLQGLASDMPRKVVRILPHGFSSNPPAQSEGILKSLGGRSDRAQFIGGEHPQYRQKNLPSGNAVLYDDKGNVVWMKGAGGIAVTTKQGGVAVTAASASSFEVKSGDLTITVDGGNVYVDPKGQIVYLGGNPNNGGVFDQVMTQSGPSPYVYARIG